jgi:hypothetical protein
VMSGGPIRGKRSRPDSSSLPRIWDEMNSRAVRAFLISVPPYWREAGPPQSAAVRGAISTEESDGSTCMAGSADLLDHVAPLPLPVVGQRWLKLNMVPLRPGLPKHTTELMISGNCVGSAKRFSSNRAAVVGSSPNAQSQG